MKVKILGTGSIYSSSNCAGALINDNTMIDIHAPKGAKEILLSITETLTYEGKMTDFIKNNCDFTVITDGYEAEIDGHIYVAHRVQHDVEAYGFIVDHKLGFTGDSSMCDVISSMASECSTLVCDCSKLKGNTKHIGIDNILELTKSNPGLRLIPTHFRDKTRERLRAMHLPNVPVTEDGYTFDV